MSWGLLFPLGVIMARYLRVFKSDDPAWFYLHIACQCSGYVLSVAGWGLGPKLGSESKGITYYTHHDIGIALFCFATLQDSSQKKKVNYQIEKSNTKEKGKTDETFYIGAASFAVAFVAYFASRSSLVMNSFSLEKLV
uniref:Cytochrome b561 domain-containing protein n=1 Tax=Ananas comosus var. bracteatus TaxID=296719 RepID=A0A6V7PQ40_ANACO|nr:unnamed protein product [Ananas comosus var. bracteatus]